MKILINADEISALKSREKVPLQCYNCNNIFYKGKNDVLKILKGLSTHKGMFCTRECMGNFKTKSTSKTINCKNCNKPVIKNFSELTKVKNSFCSSSCSATYSNINKTTGYRRSKIEKYIENKVLEFFPTLIMETNNRKLLGLELDFYFPELKFAVELNGIFHYEPIYGATKFNKIQDNDKQKIIQCYNLGVELCVINTSHYKQFNDKQKNEVWQIIFNILNKIQLRTRK